MRQARTTSVNASSGTPLPVDEVIPTLRGALATGTSAVLQAPPGAGKTTHVPLALLHEPWLGDSKILMLEPRRLAARAVTHRMAQILGERAGDTVGYRVRRDTRVGPRTRIEVVTEGILTRMWQSDPTLDGIGLVIFDEFHERSIHADTGLALALHSRSLVRPDLRIVAMSATLDGARVAVLLGDAPVITSGGRMYPIELVYSPRPDGRALASVVASKVERALRDNSGSILVFLPGGREIRNTAAALDGRMPGDVRVTPLYGDLSQQLQDAAIRPAPTGTRKVVLATPIAETSLTIDGVGVVIDSGLARAPRFSPRSGMTHLETVRISRSSADQRAGRAGRTGPGKCYRLWPENEHHQLPEHSSAEILQADLAPLVLELAVAGIRNASELRWMDPPPAAAAEQGTRLLTMLGALDASGSATPHGRAMAALPVHPRIAHMLISARSKGAGALACDVAAILGERDFLRGIGAPADADIEIRLELMHAPAPPRSVFGAEVDVPLVRRAIAESAALRRELGIKSDTGNAGVSAGVVLALAYPDRIAQSRGDSSGARFLLRNGRGATLTHPQGLSAAQHLVAATLDGDAQSARIFLGASLTHAEIEAHFSDQMETERVVEWDERLQSVRALKRVRLGAIVLTESAASGQDTTATTGVLLGIVRRDGIGALPWSDGAVRLRARVAFMRAHHADWPDVSDTALLAGLDDWLAPMLAGRTSLRELKPYLDHAIMAMVGWERREELDRLAPTHYVAPTGTRVAIDYGDPDAPSVAIRLQEMFGVRDTPTIDGGHVPLTLELLSPARRPVQVTRDLAGFWGGSYFDVRKEMRGRHPRHAWPDDPLSATPTPRAKRRGE
jgi:ATP-dependent helicase HrpB